MSLVVPRRSFLVSTGLATGATMTALSRSPPPPSYKNVQWGLGLEHEFAIDLGRIDTAQKQRFVQERLQTDKSYRGSRVILDLREFIEFPQTRTIPLTKSRPIEPNSRLSMSKISVFLHEFGKTMDLDLSDASQTEVLDELTHYEGSYLSGYNEFVLIPIGVRSETPLQTRQEVFQNLISSLRRVMKFEKVWPFDKIEGAEKLAILAEVKSNEFRNASPRNIIDQVSREEQAVIERVRSHLDQHESKDYQTIRDLFPDPRIVFDADDRNLLKIGSTVREVRASYLGSYHVWMTVPHPTIADKGPKEVLEVILPEFVDMTRVFGYLVQWMEPLILGFIKGSHRPSYRHLEGVQNMGETDLTLLKTSLRDSVLGPIPNMTRDNLIGRITNSRNRVATEATVMVEELSLEPRHYVDIRTEGMLDIVKVPVRKNEIDLEAWKQNTMLRGIEIRIFDNTSTEKMDKVISELYEIMWILSRDKDRPYVKSLKETSLQQDRRAIHDKEWKAIAESMVSGTRTDVSPIMSKLRFMVDPEIYDRIETFTRM